MWKSFSDWQVKLAVEKCVTVHFGRKKSSLYLPTQQHQTQNVFYRTWSVCYLINNLWTNHTFKIVKQAMGLLASHSKAFISRCADMHLKPYKKMDRPPLEFVSQAWNTYLAQHIKLETVEKCATKWIPTVRPIPFLEPRSSLSIDTLKIRYLAADLIGTNSIIHHLPNSNPWHGFQFHITNTHRHAYNIKKQNTALQTFGNILSRS